MLSFPAAATTTTPLETSTAVAVKYGKLKPGCPKLKLTTSISLACCAAKFSPSTISLSSPYDCQEKPLQPRFLLQEQYQLHLYCYPLQRLFLQPWFHDPIHHCTQVVRA